MEIPSHVSAKTQSWKSKNVCKVMPYQDSGDCSAEPGSWFSFRAELDLRQEHKQVEWFINNCKALVLHTLVLRINITHMSDPIKSTASSTAHKMKAH